MNTVKSSAWWRSTPAKVIAAGVGGLVIGALLSGSDSAELAEARERLEQLENTPTRVATEVVTETIDVEAERVAELDEREQQLDRRKERLDERAASWMSARPRSRRRSRKRWPSSTSGRLRSRPRSSAPPSHSSATASTSSARTSSRGHTAPTAANSVTGRGSAGSVASSTTSSPTASPPAQQRSNSQAPTWPWRPKAVAHGKWGEIELPPGTRRAVSSSADSAGPAALRSRPVRTKGLSCVRAY